MGSSPPVIGLTTYLTRAQMGVWDVRASFLPQVYFKGVTDAGGAAVLLPPQPVDADLAERVLDSLDGLLITGGNDVDPGAYGQQPHPNNDTPAPERDDWEFALLRGALARRLPVLGICRGAQVLNVALGGSLHQHLPDVIGHSGHRAGNAVFTTLPVRTVAGTRLASLVGESVDARCYHHQAIADLGEGLVVSGWDADGVVEALELPGDDFVLAVQWHPEESLDDLRLFSAIVEAARVYAEKERHQ
jgi:putative glutamine amidotransferase